MKSAKTMWVRSSMRFNANRHLQTCARALLLLPVGALLVACALSGDKSAATKASAPTAVAPTHTGADISKSAAAGTMNGAAMPTAVPPEAQQQFDKALALLK